MNKLVKLLEYTRAGNTERSRIENTASFQKTVLDTIPKEQKELLLNEGMESTTLLQESVYNQIIEGAQAQRCMRDAIPNVKIGDHQMRVTYASGGIYYADEVAEGAAIPIKTDNFDSVTIEPKKIGVRPVITNEMIEDGLWNMVAWHLNWAGRAIENKLNRDCLDAFIGGTNVSDATGAATVAKIATNKATIKKNGFNPDMLIIDSGFEEDLLSEGNLIQAQQYGNNSILKTGELQPILGLDIKRLTSVTGDTYDWDQGFDAGNEYGALLFDSKAPFMMLGIKRDISIEQYDDPIHDLAGISATMRYGTAVVQPNAGLSWKYS